MRKNLCVLGLLIATATASAFYIALGTVAAERDEKSYDPRLVVHSDFMQEAARSRGGDYGLEANGRIASVNPATSEFVLTENFKNLKFRVAADTMVLINGQPAKLADLNGGDEATVVYTRQGQQLNATVVRCTRKLST